MLLFFELAKVILFYVTAKFFWKNFPLLYMLPEVLLYLGVRKRLFGRTQTVVWAYANSCLGVRKR